MPGKLTKNIMSAYRRSDGNKICQHPHALLSLINAEHRARSKSCHCLMHSMILGITKHLKGACSLLGIITLAWWDGLSFQ